MTDANNLPGNTPAVLQEASAEPKVGEYVGQCKWFNDNLGFGFITIQTGDSKGRDIFVHHSGIKPLNSNYKTLKKGEYINFDIVEGENGQQAVNVTGIGGGSLICDVSPYHKGGAPYYVNGPRPYSGNANGGGGVVVGNNRYSMLPPPPPPPPPPKQIPVKYMGRPVSGGVYRGAHQPDMGAPRYGYAPPRYGYQHGIPYNKYPMNNNMYAPVRSGVVFQGRNASGAGFRQPAVTAE